MGMTIEELAQKLKEADTDNGGEPMFFTVKTPLPGDPDGWYIELEWAHHDGDITIGVARGLNFSETAQKALRLIHPAQEVLL